MGINDRVARLEQQIAPAAPSMADRLAVALRKGRERREAMTAEEWEAWQRARHEAALTAPRPGERASVLAWRLYEANLRLARVYFAREDALCCDVKTVDR